MKNSNHLRNTILFVGVIALLLTIGLYAYLYKGTLGLVETTINGRKIASASEVMRLQEKDIMDLYDRSSQSRSRLTTFFVPSENAVSFLRTIESVGSSSGATVVISAIKSAPPSADGDSKIGQVSANVNVTGSWTEVMRALELFEALPYLDKIGHMTLNTSAVTEATEKPGQKWTLAFDINASSI